MRELAEGLTLTVVDEVRLDVRFAISNSLNHFAQNRHFERFLREILVAKGDFSLRSK